MDEFLPRTFDPNVSLFSTGCLRAKELRRGILDAFGAEPDWMGGSDSDEVIAWTAGPVTTLFIAEDVHPSVPGLGMLTILSFVLTADSAARARDYVEASNRYATLSRWVALPSNEIQLRCSFVVGDPQVEIPFRAMLLTVGQHMSDTAFAALRAADAEGLEVVDPVELGKVRPQEDWHSIIYTHSHFVEPHRGASPAPLMESLAVAFNQELELQFAASPAAWYGNADSTSLTCEVPYGPGPYSLGVIGMRAMAPHLESSDNETSLIQAFEVDNPDVGKGLMLAMRLWPNVQQERVSELLDGLNSRLRMRSDQQSPGSAHGLGAWIYHNDALTLTCLLPSGWAEVLDDEEQVTLLRQLLSNAARLSWDAHGVLDSAEILEERLRLAIQHPEEVTSDPAIPPGLAGFAAGDRARGPHFGELWVGTDPGAHVLAFLWTNLVGHDDEWGYLLRDASGFTFWTGPSRVEVRSFRCMCAEEGSLVRLRTQLGVDSDDLRSLLKTLLSEGEPVAVHSHDGHLWATSRLHVHSDNLYWCRHGATLLAIAQALLCERVEGVRGDVDLATPDDGRIRPDRDQMLNLYRDLPSMPNSKTVHPSGTALIHGSALLLTAPYSLRELDDGHFEMRWLHGSGDPSGTEAVSTTYGYLEHPDYGTCLRIRTCLRTTLEHDAFDLNESDDGGFVLGGIHESSGGVSCTSLYPTLLDQTGKHAGQTIFVGTALMHHTSRVGHLLTTNPGIHADTASGQEVAEGVERLLQTYRAHGGASPQLELLTQYDGDRLSVQWAAPAPAVGGHVWPRLVGNTADDGSQRGQVVLGIGDATHAGVGLRLLNAALALSGRPDYALDPVGYPLVSIAEGLTEADLDRLTEHLVEAGQLWRSSDGEISVADTPTRFSLELKDGSPLPADEVVIDVEAREPSFSDAMRAAIQQHASFLVGSWRGNGYTLRLPRSVFGQSIWWAKMETLETIVLDVVGAIKAAPIERDRR